MKHGLGPRSWEEAIENGQTALDTFMIRHGIRSRHLAEEAGISEQYVCNLRKGRNGPGTAALARIVPILQRSVSHPLSVEDFIEVTP